MKRLLLAAASLALAACHGNERCSTDAQCAAPEEACRPAVTYCPGYSNVATLGEGYCRDVGASCGTTQDCVPLQTCSASGTCKPDPSLCSGPTPTCPTGCTWTSPFPCACVCPACPPPP